AQRVAEGFDRPFVFVVEVASTAGGREVDESSLVEPARDLRTVRVDEHLLVLALYVVDRDRATGGRADTEREDVDAPGEIRIENREVGYGILSVRDDHDRPRPQVIRGRRELRGRAVERGLERGAGLHVEAVAGCIERRAHDLRRCRQRIAQHARAAEERDADAPPTQLLAKELDRALRHVKAIGLDIAK